MPKIIKKMTTKKQGPLPKTKPPKRFSGKTPMVQKTDFQIGDAVYARYHGDDVLKIVGIADVASPAPHYICEIDGQRYVISKFHLSTKRLTGETEDCNRRQLSIQINNA